MQPTMKNDSTTTIGADFFADFSEIEELSKEEKAELLKMWKEKTWQYELTGIDGNTILFGVNIFDYQWSFIKKEIVENKIIDMPHTVRLQAHRQDHKSLNTRLVALL